MMGDNTLKSNLGGFSIPDVSQIDANKLSRSTRGNQGPDFIPYNKRGRDIFGRLSLYTGAPWLGGFTVGKLRTYPYICLPIQLYLSSLLSIFCS